jgi:ADP-heptose:LPS heptosyltransferase
MRIAVRFEGGTGDHLLGNRLIPAILDKYPNAKIDAFSDTEGNNRSISLLYELFPSFYNHVELVPYRKSQHFPITTQFGVENYPAHFDNMPDECRERWASYDKFYDLHIDSLKWMNYEFDWLRYFYFFPKPQTLIETPKPAEDYILAHLYARPGSSYNMEQWYVIELIRKLSKSIKVIIVTQASDMAYYQELVGENVEVNTASSLKEIFYLARDCRAFIGIDSGVRYIPYHFSKPVFVFSKDCAAYGSPNLSHLIRWLIYPLNVFPTHFDMSKICRVIQDSLTNPASQLYPLIGDLNQRIVKRF